MSTGLPEPARHYPRLVADIGGTNARFGLVRSPQATVTDIATLAVRDHAGPSAAALAYLRSLSNPLRDAPRAAAFAFATPIHGDRAKLTNSPWEFSRTETRAALGVDRLLVINDFEALALSLPLLQPHEYRVLGPAQPVRQLPMVVIGPGTGLGVGAVVPVHGGAHGWVAVPGEGGHVTLAATDDFESDVLRAARREFAHVSAERLLSGIGLPVLYRAVATVHGSMPRDLSPQQISSAATEGSDPVCVLTIETFCAFLGNLAGNAALTVGALGGVFIGGGIVPHLGELFFRSRFRERFEAKGRFQPYLAGIATALIIAPYPALAGANQAIDLSVLAERG